MNNIHTVGLIQIYLHINMTTKVVLTQLHVNVNITIKTTVYHDYKFVLMIGILLLLNI